MLEMLIISSSTSSSLLFQWHCEGWNGILWKVNGPNIELEASPSVLESELMPSMSELSFEVEGCFEGTIEHHFLRIWLGTGSQVTEIKVASFNTGHQTKEMEELTKVKDPVLYTYFTLYKLTGSHDVKASWERPVIWIDDRDFWAYGGFIQMSQEEVIASSGSDLHIQSKRSGKRLLSFWSII